jgi:hypothetical protein
MNEKSKWNIVIGNYAKTLRRSLFDDLSDHDVEAIVISLVSHLMVEGRINQFLYKWLLFDLPQKGPESLQTAVVENKKMEAKLWQSITNLQFAPKYSIIEPIMANWFPNEVKDIWKLNDLRNDIFHGRKLKDVKFKGKSIGTNEGIEEVFMTAQCFYKRLDMLSEEVEGPHLLSKKWAKRLKELGESLE